MARLNPSAKGYAYVSSSPDCREETLLVDQA
jgi:hypothetical protein